MKFKIGDTVKFLNEKGRGKVTRIINKTTVGITIEDGFELPFLISELIMEFNENQSLNQPILSPLSSLPDPIQSIQLKSTQSDKKEIQGIYMAFSPEKINDISNSDINVWLINHTHYKTLFTYSILNTNKFITLETGNIDAFSSVLVETIDKTELNDHTNLKTDVLFFDDKQHSYQLPISEIIKLKPIKLYKQNAFETNNFLVDKALLLTVFELADNTESTKSYNSNTDLSKILFQKLHHKDSSKKSKPHANNNPANEMEIDLHIEELLENYSGMNNAEIIQVQLKHFQDALDTAINNHYKKLIVIHGIGNGRLKQEVRNILSSNKSLKYYDASYSRYGFGATEIVIY